MPGTVTVLEVAKRVLVGASTEREKAIAIHDFVRENVRFGFNKYFDAGSPDYTLACGYGHCNPKSRLLVALFTAVGLESYQHFVVLPKEILRDAIPVSRYWMIPAELSHSYVDVRVEGMWCAIDSHIVDTALLHGAQARLEAESRTLGFGTRKGATNIWNGQSDAFSQFDPRLMREDHGRIVDLETYFGDRRYRNRVFGLRFNATFKLMGEAGVAPMNAHIEAIRAPLMAPTVPLS
ncbi:MAG: transglutaminase-like domain-containing protein [Anaerolineae bacterium]|nr:transglutaminase-like domain-containing protein [Anaerolineae bacterium]